MKNTILRLKDIGFTEYEARAYMALLKENPATAYEVAKISGIPTSKIYEIINRLEAKEIIRPIQGERSNMYIPLSPDQFIQGYRSSMDENLHHLHAELQGISSEIDTNYTWRIKDYERLIQRAKIILETVQETILLLIWPEEMKFLSDVIQDTEKRGIKLAIVHYGATNLRVRQLYKHPPEDTVYAKRNTRGFTLVADSKEALTGKIGGKDKVEAVWSMNEGFVIMAEDYIRHDIYFMKLASRFNPLLQEKFGRQYEKLMDVFSDDAAAVN